MTNFDYYRDLINHTNFGMVDGEITNCTATSCRECKFYSCTENCTRIKWAWLKEEYIESKISIPKDTPIDTKVLVSDSGENWLKRYYAGFKNGKHHAWLGGADSWSKDRDDDVAFWEYMKLAEEE